MDELIYSTINDRDRFFTDVGSQLLHAAEMVIRQGYDVGLELNDPRVYQENGRDYLRVDGQYNVKNNNTGKTLKLSVGVEENSKFTLGYETGVGVISKRAPKVQLSFSNIDFNLNGITPTVGCLQFLVQVPSDHHSWICRKEANQVFFYPALSHLAGIFAHQPNPLLMTAFRGFRAVPHFEEGVAERPTDRTDRQRIQGQRLD